MNKFLIRWKECISKRHLHYIIFKHLADAFIQSDLQCIQAILFFFMCSLDIEPTTFCTAKAMLYRWATGTPCNIYMLQNISI